MKEQALPIIGERIRADRRKLRMSLSELAQRTELSKGFLSQVERGLSSPSIETLSLIADVLRTPMFLFFIEDDAEKVIMRQAEQRKIEVPASRFEYKSIWFGTSRKMEVLIGLLKPGESSTDQAQGHTVHDFASIEECFVVLQGKVELQLGEESYILDQGDSAYFNGTIPHRYTALGEEELALLFAIAPPAFSR